MLSFDSCCLKISIIYIYPKCIIPLLCIIMKDERIKIIESQLNW